ncbi:MAG: DNA polymerase III subunit alpha [Pirellulaceae bacterium]|nr:DNA polymerase III subunit alpha [Pirellulaceae bacterium]
MTQSRSFVHLHCHSHYSLLDGAGSIGRLVARAKQHGMNALALTDHGNLHGALEFYRKAREAGIKPIVGYEAYIAPGSRFDKSAGRMKEASYHLTLLASNRTGFQNLIKLASAAFLEGFYFKPRIDKELLAAHHEGLVCLSGCVSSEFSRALLRGQAGDEDLAEAIEVAQWFHRLFGDRYYIEIMNNGIDIQRQAMLGSLDVARKLGLPLVATCDTHYVDPDDAEAQDVMLCINTGKFRTDTSRMRMDGNEYYLKTPEEMYQAFTGHEDAVERSQQIADQVDLELELGKRHFPTYGVPAGQTAEQFLRELCLEGLRQRYADQPEMCRDGQLQPVVLERLERELSVINKLGFPNYFLICWDFVREARRQAIPATARGSGVGALVCYALYLSHVCPISYGLLFERFLDENRLEAPDIDIDFCKDRRGDVIRYVKEKYGAANVAQIGTFGTLAARAAIKDVGRVLGIPLPRVNQVTAMVPEQLGISLKKALETSEELKQAYDNDAEVRELLDLAMRIEGLARNVGTHAAAVVIADRPLTEYVPLGRVTGKDDIITQWSMGDVEAAGLLKMDFLGLRNLTILRKAVDLIEQTTGQQLDLHRLPLDDKATFALLCRGETKGVFQLESGGIRDLLQKMKPDHFRDIIATNALYRPGPLEGGMVRDYVEVKHGRQRAEYKHPVLKDILEETNGVMVYQEQVMQILNRLGDIPLAAAYTCIKAISKKKEALINQNREQFLLGATSRGLTDKEASEFWDMIAKFAGYGFNKCVVGQTRIVDAESGRPTTVEQLFLGGGQFTIHALGDDGRLRPRRVVDVVWNGRRPVYRLTTRQGRSLTATANHPLRTAGGWTLLGQLRPGDRIAAGLLPGFDVDCDGDDQPGGNDLAACWRPAAGSSACAVAASPLRQAMAAASGSASAAAIAWDEVCSVEPAGVEDTYDLEVEIDHNFVAEGLVVHNSHSTAYALIAYQTAYLKAHYPVEFMAALLSGDIPARNFKTKDSLVEHLEDCERMGVKVSPPDVNSSDADFTVVDGKILFGLSAIKGCGGGTADAISAARRRDGAFRDLFDFCERVDASDCNKATIETLIKAGAFDSLGARRAQLMAVVDRALQAGASALADRRSGQKSLFGDLDEEPGQGAAAVSLPDLPEFEERERLLMEKEVLGFYLSSHPLAEYEKTLATYCSHTTATLAGLPDRAEVVLGGMLSAIKLAHTKNPRPGAPSKYANFDLEDMAGAIRCILWPDSFQQYGELVKQDAILVIRGSLDYRGGDEANLIVDELIPLDQLDSRYTNGMVIRIVQDRYQPDILRKVREIVRAYPGNCQLELLLCLEDGQRAHLRGGMRIEVSLQLRQRLDDLLGPGNYQLMTSSARTAGANGGGARRRPATRKV